MAAEPYTAVGRIVKTHGVKGEVSVKPYAEASLDVLVGMQVWFVPPPAQMRTSTISGVRPGPKGPVVLFDGISDITGATAITGRELLVSTESLPAEWSEPDSDNDVVGMSVTDEERGDLGSVVEVIVTGANDVWVVDGPLGEVLIPVIDDVVLGYDEETDTAHVRLLEGLLDEPSEQQ